MKQGWIQVDSNGGKEELAPKTMADLVYVDEGRKTTVKDALAEGFVAVFTHTVSEVNGKRVHNFEGPSDFEGMGRALIIEAIQPIDQIMVNGIERDAFQGGEVIFSTMIQGHWVTFVVDGAKINFNMGGAGNYLRVISASSKELLPIVEKENTLGIITSETIIRWEMNENQPLNPVDGMVWIQTGSASATPFSLDHRNSLMVYPVRGAQYVSNSWVNKEIYAFQSGQWKAMGVFLYNQGEIVTSLTGGYNNYVGDGRTTSVPTDFARYRIIDNTDCVHIELDDQSVWWSGGAFKSTKLKIDLTAYKSLVLIAKNAECSVTMPTHANSVWIANAISKSPYDQTMIDASYSSKSGDVVITLDISAYTGSYYVGFGAKAGPNAYLAKSVMDVTHVMLLTA